MHMPTSNQSHNSEQFNSMFISDNDNQKLVPKILDNPSEKMMNIFDNQTIGTICCQEFSEKDVAPSNAFQKSSNFANTTHHLPCRNHLLNECSVHNFL